jgi:type I restriction enzyme S subunit
MPDIEQLRCPLPPILEQKRIVIFVSRQTERFDALMAKAEHSIALLKERRSALITAAVTGQIDLREEAA